MNEQQRKGKKKQQHKSPPAPKEFKKYGYTFVLVSQELRIALYRQEKDGEVFGYEVHVLDRHSPYTQPKSKFGLNAWSFTSEAEAKEKFEELRRWEFEVRR